MIPGNASSVTAALIVAFGVFVMYTQWKNWFDSNLPLIYYAALFAFTRSTDGAVPFWLICAGCGLALILRFEFMSTGPMRVVKFLELGALGAMIYMSAAMIVRF